MLTSGKISTISDEIPKKTEIKIELKEQLHNAQNEFFGGLPDYMGKPYIKGEVSEKNITKLIQTANEWLSTEDKRNVMDNIPTDNARLIFEEAQKALDGNATYNRMLWKATGLLMKEQSKELGGKFTKLKFMLKTGIVLANEQETEIYGRVLKDYRPIEMDALEKFEKHVEQNKEDILDLLTKNYPISQEESTIRSPLHTY